MDSRDQPDIRPLLGKRVLVTRARGQAGELSRLLVKAGAEPVEVPAIQIMPPESWEAADHAIAGIESYDWALFTSANAVRAFSQRLQALGRDAQALSGTRVAAIGPATAQALAAEGLQVDFMPEKYVGESLLEGLISRGVAGNKILLPRAAEGRELIVDSLRSLGAELDEVHIYRTVADPGSGSVLVDLVERGRLDAITFASSSAVLNLVALLGEAGPKMISGCVIACIGPITAETASELGLRVDVVPPEYTLPALVRAMEDYYRR